MQNHKLLVAAVYLLCLAACAGHRQGEHHPRRTGTNNSMPVYSVGIVVKDVEGQLLIDAFDVEVVEVRSRDRSRSGGGNAQCNPPRRAFHVGQHSDGQIPSNWFGVSQQPDAGIGHGRFDPDA